MEKDIASLQHVTWRCRYHVVFINYHYDLIVRCSNRRHLRYLKEHRRGFYTILLTKCELNRYIADLDKQAEDMFFTL